MRRTVVAEEAQGFTQAKSMMVPTSAADRKRRSTASPPHDEGRVVFIGPGRPRSVSASSIVTGSMSMTISAPPRIDYDPNFPPPPPLSQPGVCHPTTTSPPQQPHPKPKPLSGFDISRMPRDAIHKRTLHQWSVHHSLVTKKWIATICRPEVDSVQQQRYLQFTLPTEREARKFCVAYAPPKMKKNGPNCLCCQTGAPSYRNCRNCGVMVCERCCVQWGRKMVPKTYISSSPTFTVRVCKSCDWLSNAFCMALLQGRHQDAKEIHSTGNVNLRTSFGVIHREAMFPIHCAVLGGSIDSVRWLVESHLCPISVAADPKTKRMMSVQTSASRTLVDLAMTGRPKLDVLQYLIQKGLSMEDVKDPSLVGKTMEALLKSSHVNMTSNGTQQASVEVNVIEPVMVAASSSFDGGDCQSVTTLEDACNLCCERSMSDCVLQPCGHQMCCAECGQQLTHCPICKVKCSVLRIYRQ